VNPVSFLKLLHSLLTHLLLLLQLKVIRFLIQFKLNFTHKILLFLVLTADSDRRCREVTTDVGSLVP
jgi:hypothetical protein